MIEITVNDSPRHVPTGTTIESLLQILTLQPRFLAVELNRRVVSRAEHARIVLSQGDIIEIVTLVGGG